MIPYRRRDRYGITYPALSSDRGHVIGHVDRWLAELFDPDQFNATLAQVLDADQTDPGTRRTQCEGDLHPSRA